jgi:trimeric autotransporter adhesin
MKQLICLFFILSPYSIKSQIISTVAGNGLLGYSGDGGAATAAKLHLPGKVIFDQSDNLYIADSWSHRIRKVDRLTGIITTIAGTGIAGYSGDGMPATSAQLNDPIGLAFDLHGNLYIGEGLNHRVRKINMTTGLISTYAGNGYGAGGFGGYSGDGGPATAAELNAPGYIVFDTSDNLFICDHLNYRIRKVNAVTGIISTYAGSGGNLYFGDGGAATTAGFSPEGLAFDQSGNLYIADTNCAVRKVNTLSGVITTIAGIASYGYTGDGGAATAAQIQVPYDLYFDGARSLYIAEFGGRIRKVDVLGIISTAAGTSVFGYNGDGIPATTAKLNETTGIAVDACGSLYIADASNERIRKVSYPPILTIPSISLSGVVSMPVASTVTVTATVSNAGSSYLIHWLNHGIEFTTTTGPSVTYTKPPGTDTITARIVPTGWGCWDSTTSSQHIVSTDVTGFSSVNEPWCMVYPNPAHTTLTAATPWKEGTLTIYNTIGQTVLAKQFYKRGIPVNVGNLPAGIYMVKITGAESETVITRFIKQ